MPSFWLSLFFLWPFQLILLSASSSLAPKASYFLLYFIQFLLFAGAGSSFTFVSVHFYFSAFCFFLVLHVTQCFKNTALNALTAPSSQILFWEQITASRSHSIHYCLYGLGTSRFPSPCFGEGAEPPAKADAEVSTSLGWAGILQLPGSRGQAVREFWHTVLHHNVPGSRLQVSLHSEAYWARFLMIAEMLVQPHGSISCHPSIQPTAPIPLAKSAA